MSEATEIAAFGAHLRRAFGDFQHLEADIRRQYKLDTELGKAAPGVDEEDLLERPTRRFLIDVILRGLDWNPDDPHQIAEEARSWGKDGDRYYFDYVGIAPQTQTPVILVEAKGYDVSAARRPRGEVPDATKMAELIRDALHALKQGNKSSAIIAEWAEWLRDLRNYVVSLGTAGQSTLQRLVITAGRWIVIFQEPLRAFVQEGTPNTSHIHCFVDPEEILSRHNTVFKLLHRRRLVDTLPLVMPMAEALGVLRPPTISHMFRGVLVTTSSAGARLKRYPTRSVYPAVILLSADRRFAIADFHAPTTLEEPRGNVGIADFHRELGRRGSAFEGQLKAALGRPDLVPGDLTNFPGFPDLRQYTALGAGSLPPLAGSTAAYAAGVGSDSKQLVTNTVPGSQEPEYLVATGQAWFYKRDMPFGPDCALHSFAEARQAGVASGPISDSYSASSFTRSDEPLHCAHDGLRSMRRQRCQIAVVETHLCCRACVFHDSCWLEDMHRMPCPGD